MIIDVRVIIVIPVDLDARSFAPSGDVLYDNLEPAVKKAAIKSAFVL